MCGLWSGGAVLEVEMNFEKVFVSLGSFSGRPDRLGAVWA